MGYTIARRSGFVFGNTGGSRAPSRSAGLPLAIKSPSDTKLLMAARAVSKHKASALEKNDSELTRFRIIPHKTKSSAFL